MVGCLQRVIFFCLFVSAVFICDSTTSGTGPFEISWLWPWSYMCTEKELMVILELFCILQLRYILLNTHNGSFLTLPLPLKF